MQNNFDNISRLDSSSSSALATHKVLRQTYALLGVSLFPTVIGAVIGMNMSWAWAASLGFGFPILMLVTLWGMFALIQRNRNSSVGVVLLLGLTFMLGLWLGPMLQMAFSFSNGGQIVSLAAGGTGSIFLALSAIGSNAKRDFSYMGKFLMIGFILAFLAIIANWFFQIPALSLAISSVMVMIMSGFILFDVNRIVRGGETNYVMATLSLYMNIYILFQHLLHLLMALMGNRD